jgi:hypothetical protein
MFEGDPSELGPHAAAKLDVTIDAPDDDLAAFGATVWGPSLDGGQSLGVVGKAPLMLLMPGFTRKHGNYENLANRFASWGFVVLGLSFLDEAKHDQNTAQAMAAIDFAIDPAGPLAGLLDGQKIAVAGHSLGGKIAFMTAASDPRVKVVVGWDPVDSGGAPCWVPVAGKDCHKWSVAPNSFEGDEGMMGTIQAAQLIFHAPPGLFNPEAHNSLRFWEGTQAPAELVKIPDASHLDWGVAEQGKWDVLTVRTQVPFMLKHLYGATGTEPFLTGAVMQADVSAGTVALEVKE